jgi:hypothetical protein
LRASATPSSPRRPRRSSAGDNYGSPRWPGLLWGGGVFLALGLLTLVGLFWFLYRYVATNPDPGIRWQTVQMIQAVHFLWPPFLFAHLYRRVGRAVRAGVDGLVHNLPYYQH